MIDRNFTMSAAPAGTCGSRSFGIVDDFKGTEQQPGVDGFDISKADLCHGQFLHLQGILYFLSVSSITAVTCIRLHLFLFQICSLGKDRST